MADELDELLDFLLDKRPGVRQHALDILLGLTGAADGLERLKAKTSKLVVLLLRLVCDADKAASEKALSCLVNISQDTALAEALRKQNTINRCMDYLKEQTCAHPRLLVMLLSNLTASEDGCSELLQLGHEKLEGLYLAILLKRFVMSGLMFEPGQEDTYEHVACILTNVTQHKRAREMLLQPGRGTLQALAANLQAPSLLRRRGVAGALRNCFMQAEADGTVAQVAGDPAVLRGMLRPIDGCEPKEQDDLVREAMAESIMVLAALEEGRKALWEVQAPEIIKKGYEYEVHPGVCKALEHAAEYFLSHAQIDDGLGAPVVAAAEAPAPAATSTEESA